MVSTRKRKPKQAQPNPLHQAAHQLLTSIWKDVLDITALEQARDAAWSQIAAEIINEGGKTYPYVLLGQVLGKASDASVNALALQDSSALDGARDIRSLVRFVVVPWNNLVGKPFPGSNEDPYVNNPARHPEFGPVMRAKAGNKVHYDHLYKIVEHVQSLKQEEAVRFLKLILIETRLSLEQNKRDYVGPSRASLKDVIKAIELFLAERSNGVRLQIVCYSVFKATAQAFPNFGEVRSYSTNSSDAAGDRAGDVERLINGTVDFVVEVKDRTLTLSDVEGSILKARTANIPNLLFVVQANPILEDEISVMQRAAHEFTRGIDVNVAEAIRFFESVLTLLSPEQRAAFLRTVHNGLHELGAHYKHVHRWIEIIKTM